MNKLVILLSTILLLVVLSLIEQKLSIVIWGAIWLVIGRAIIIISLNRNSNLSSTLYFVFFFIYLLYSSIVNYAYVSNPSQDFFYARDSLHFFAYSNTLGELVSFRQVLEVSFTDFTSGDWKGFALLSGIVAFSSNLIDQNNIIVQKLIVVFFSSMIIPFLYAIANNYFSKKQSIGLCVIYGLLSYSLFYSAVFIRDTPIGLFFVIFAYLFYTPLSINKVPVFIFLSFITYLFRPEHGMFSVIFLLAYLFFYLKEKKSKYKYLLLVPILTFTFLFISDKVNVILDTIGSTTDSYLTHSLEEANSSSFGAALLQLPWGIRHVATGLFSQTLPFPFYIGLDLNGLGFIPLSVAALFWFFIWVIIIRGLTSKKSRSFIDYRLWLLFMIGIVLVLGASVNADTRRIMAVNPVFFMVSMNIYHSWNGYNKRIVLVGACILYLGLLLVYLFAKN